MTSPVEAVTARAQTAAAALMTDTCRIEDVGEVLTSDDGTDTAAKAVAYEGPCRVKPLLSRAEGGNDPGPAPTGEFLYQVSVPVGSEPLGYGQRVTVLTSLDPSLAGRVLQVRSIERGSQISARRMRCAEVSR